MLKKMVNGTEVEMSPQEEAQCLDFWAMNAAHPEYSGACCWDGLNQPFYDMEVARKIHQDILTKQQKKAYDDICLQIEVAMDEGMDFSALLQKRKAIRNYVCPELSQCNTIDEIKAVKLETF